MSHHAKSANHFALCILVCTVMLGLALAPAAFAQRTRLKPGMNFFSPQQDVELGQQVSQDAEKQLAMLNNARVDGYLNRLGKRLASYAPGEKYPYQFKCVNDANINAFALPGGFLFINRGTIDAADNEAELAGVIGHEIGHVALRHGTNQASKSYLAQAPLAILGSFLGSNSVGAILAQIGTGFAVNSVLLKYSRDDERQADLIGTQILYDASYDPDYMAQFFTKLGTKGGSDFFSSHPNPEDRIKNINGEIDKLGAPPARISNDTSEFRSIRQYVKSLPAAPKAATGQPTTSSSGTYNPPPRPSIRLKTYDSGYVSLRQPDNWKAYGNDQDFTLAPDGGIISDGNNSALAYGATMAVFAPAGNNVGLREATNQLIKGLQNLNSNMRITKDQGQIRIGGKTALWITLSNDSPLGGRETNWLVTVLQPEGLAYFVFVAPEKDFANYQDAFRQILNSVNFTGQ